MELISIHVAIIPWPLAAMVWLRRNAYFRAVEWLACGLRSASVGAEQTSTGRLAPPRERRGIMSTSWTLYHDLLIKKVLKCKMGK